MIGSGRTIRTGSIMAGNSGRVGAHVPVLLEDI